MFRSNYNYSSSSIGSWIGINRGFTSRFWSVVVDDVFINTVSFAIDKLINSRRLVSEQYHELSSKYRRDLLDFFQQEVAFKKLTMDEDGNVKIEDNSKRESTDFENYTWPDFLNLRERRKHLLDIIETAIQLRSMEHERVDGFNFFKRNSFRIIHLIVSLLYYLIFNGLSVESVGNLLMMLRTTQEGYGTQLTSMTYQSELPWMQQVIKAGLRSIVVFYFYDIMDYILFKAFIFAKSKSRTEREVQFSKVFPGECLESSFLLPQTSMDLDRIGKMEKSDLFNKFILETRERFSNILATLALCAENEQTAEHISKIVEDAKKTFKNVVKTEEEVSKWAFSHNSYKLIQEEAQTHLNAIVETVEDISRSILLECRKHCFEELVDEINVPLNNTKKPKTNSKTGKTNKKTKKKQQKKEPNDFENLVNDFREGMAQLEGLCQNLLKIVSSPPVTDTITFPFRRRENVLNGTLRIALLNLPIRTVLLYIVELLLSIFLRVKTNPTVQ